MDNPFKLSLSSAHKSVLECSAYIKVNVDENDLAEMFWGLNEDEQAVFFNKLGEISGNKLCFQLQYITDNEILTEAGRDAMQEIGYYARPAEE